VTAHSIEQLILRLATQRALALVHRDAPAIASMLSPRFVYTNSAGDVFGKEEYLRAYVLDPSVVWHRQELNDVRVEVVGDAAVLTGTVHDEARFGEFELNARFQTTQTYVRHDDAWHYLAGHTSSLKHE
jgi:ketosteroid isomerase-like protein